MRTLSQNELFLTKKEGYEVMLKLTKTVEDLTKWCSSQNKMLIELNNEVNQLKEQLKNDNQTTL